MWGRQSTTLLVPLKLSRSNSVQHSFPPLHSHISDFIKISHRGKKKKKNALHTWPPCRLQSCSWALLLVLCSEPPPWCTTMWKQQLVWAHSGNVPTTLQTYSLVTWWEADFTLIFLKSQDVLATCNYNFHQNLILFCRHLSPADLCLHLPSSGWVPEKSKIQTHLKFLHQPPIYHHNQLISVLVQLHVESVWGIHIYAVVVGNIFIKGTFVLLMNCLWQFSCHLPNMRRPEVSRSSRWIVLKFFKPCSWSVFFFKLNVLQVNLEVPCHDPNVESASSWKWKFMFLKPCLL